VHEPYDGGRLGALGRRPRALGPPLETTLIAQPDAKTVLGAILVDARQSAKKAVLLGFVEVVVTLHRR
jgi:hypothetical protein